MNFKKYSLFVLKSKFVPLFSDNVFDSLELMFIILKIHVEFTNLITGCFYSFFMIDRMA